jgi:alpha-tubulin suppressor-like RCC1 family protein
VIAISCGGYFTAALKTDGTVVAWGYNEYQQCNVPTDLGRIIALCCGYNHVVTAAEDGVIRCWGRNCNRQCDVPLNMEVRRRQVVLL